MSSSEVIEQIKSLDPQERAKVLDHLLEYEAAQKSVYLDDQSFERAADRVFVRHAELLRKLAE